MNARYYAYAPTGRALTPLCQVTQGVATLCPGLWAVALSGRAFNLQGVHSICVSAFYLQGVHSICVTCIQPAGRGFYQITT